MEGGIGDGCGSGCRPGPPPTPTAAQTTEGEKEPTPVHNTEIDAVIDICMGVTKEELDQPAATGLEVLEHGELHEESIPQLAYFRAVYVSAHLARAAATPVCCCRSCPFVLQPCACLAGTH